MGKVEEQIKTKLKQDIFNDTLAIFEFINARFVLDEAQKDEVIQKLHKLNSDLGEFLDDKKLA